MPLTEEEDLQERADHEAGHYVVAYMTKMAHKVAYITLLKVVRPAPLLSSGGSCALTFDPDPSPEQYGIYSAAGMVAQLSGIAFRNGWEFRDPRLEEAKQRVLAGATEDIEGMRAKLGRDIDIDFYGDLAGEVLGKHWDLVEELSQELKRHQILYREEAHLIVGAKLGGLKNFKPYLEVYRKHRVVFDTSGPDYEEFRAHHPGCPTWVESFMDFRARDGVKDGDDFREWYATKMGVEYEGELDEDEEDDEDEDA